MCMTGYVQGDDVTVPNDDVTPPSSRTHNAIANWMMTNDYNLESMFTIFTN